MTHLTPSVIVAMKKIMESAGVKYRFMDEQEGFVAAGRLCWPAGTGSEGADKS
jgi:hypothetical protein